jgi:hypothetical protein
MAAQVTNLDPATVGPGGADPDRPMLSDRPGDWPGGQRLIARSVGLGHGVPGAAPAAAGAAGLHLRLPRRGIPSSRVEVDAAAIRDAADSAVTLWWEDPFGADDW